MEKIGFIGVGNMGYPLFAGAIKAFGKENVIFNSKSQKESEAVSKKSGIPCAHDNVALIQECKYIVLAVKPQFFNEIYDDLLKVDTKDKVLISIAAGISIDDIKNVAKTEAKIVRCMPNTPAMVSEGMTCICFSNDAFTEEEKSVATTLFDAVGKYEIISEKLMNAAVCANGSSPAYVYMFIEALADSVVKYGIPRDQAYRLVSQTVLGAAKMVLETGEHPGKLKDNVCSPGGTTIAAVSALEEYGFRNAIIKATDACYARAEALKK